MGIDALRIVAMFLIVLGHVIRFKYDFFEASFSHQLSQYILLDCISTITLVGVNAYAMISGYVMVGRSLSFKKLLSLWFQMLFYSIGIAVVGKVLHLSIPHHPFWKYCLPLTQNLWWYMTAYFGMYPFLPFINKSLKIMNKWELLLGGCMLTIAFSLIPNLVHNRNLFQLEQGYSVVWLLVCNCFGAIAFLLKDDIYSFLVKRMHFSLGALLVLCIVVLTIMTLFKDLVHFPLKGRIICLFDDYTSPLMLLFSLVLLLFFSRLSIPAGWQPSILLLSSLTLPVYLIHVHPVVWVNYITNKAYSIPMQNHTAFGCVGIAFGLAIVFFTICSILGFCQVKLFGLVRHVCEKR